MRTASSSSWSAPRLANGQRSRRGPWPSWLVSVLSVSQHKEHFKTTFGGGRMEEVHGGLPRFQLPAVWNNLRRADFDIGHKTVFMLTSVCSSWQISPAETWQGNSNHNSQ